MLVPTCAATSFIVGLAGRPAPLLVFATPACPSLLHLTSGFLLVQFLDELIDVLEREPGLPAFLLDGQAVILEDYT